MSDYGSEYTEKQIKDIDKQITKIYKKAEKDIRIAGEKFFAKFEKDDKKKRKLLSNGKISKKEYDKWKKVKILQSKNYKKLKENTAELLAKANGKALDVSNSKVNDVFATNTNYAMYQVDEATKMNLSFDIYDATTVERLIKENPRLYPIPKELDIAKDKAWSMKKMNTQVTQSIIEGESVDKLARRLSAVAMKEKKEMMTVARTMMTSAQNGGRLQGYREAKKLGINVYKKWLSAHDGHTRVSHLYLDDEDPIPIEEPFEVNGQSIDYPGDPYAPPALVYNCRCTMISEIMDEDGNPRFTIDEDEMDAVGFEEWIEENS